MLLAAWRRQLEASEPDKGLVPMIFRYLYGQVSLIVYVFGEKMFCPWHEKNVSAEGGAFGVPLSSPLSASHSRTSCDSCRRCPRRAPCRLETTQQSAQSSSTPSGGSSEVLKSARGRCKTHKDRNPGFEPACNRGCRFFPLVEETGVFNTPHRHQERQLVDARKETGVFNTPHRHQERQLVDARAVTGFR